MTTYTEEAGSKGPVELPGGIEEAFRANGYAPLTVILVAEDGAETVFVRKGAEIAAPDDFDPGRLELPHMHVARYGGEGQALRVCKCLVCTRYGCYWVPCPC